MKSLIVALFLMEIIIGMLTPSDIILLWFSNSGLAGALMVLGDRL